MDKKIIAGNWKMNGNMDAVALMADALKNIDLSHVTIVLCLPMPFVGASAILSVETGVQDCSAHESGAYTGEVSARMISEIGAKYVIIGHSERRQYHNETNLVIAEKAKQALKSGLIPIICVGETMEEKQAGETNTVIEKQIRECVPGKGAIIAYEPRWAIGAGMTPSNEEIKREHGFIAEILESMGLGGTPILYGASVKGGNAAEIMSIPNVDGVLVGGASLKAEDFLPIIQAV
ncbi:MAG: triose-phosphate isomerase [Alphaproteobacteria bacterium]|nr:triose-phosphate isomerase [Alphaproteobacteria bacterium]